MSLPFGPDPKKYGCRYLTLSLVPALVGATLPFWLGPARFSFRWLAAIEFFAATVCFHAGFSFLLERFQNRAVGLTGSRLSGTAAGLIFCGCLLGLLLNHSLILRHGVPSYIFLLYCLCAFFSGVLYVAPPFSFWRRSFSVSVFSIGIGLVPVLGAYLIQVGDIYRRVYLAAIPIVVAVGLWSWTSELADRAEGPMKGCQTMTMLFGTRFGGRFVIPALVALLYATLGAAILSGAVPPLAFAALVSVVFAWKTISISRNGYADAAQMRTARQYALLVHLVTGAAIAAASLATSLRQN